MNRKHCINMFDENQITFNNFFTSPTYQVSNYLKINSFFTNTVQSHLLELVGSG